MKQNNDTLRLDRKVFGRAGSATIELCLTLMILMNVTYGVIEFGQYFYVKNQCQGAAREGARASITSGAVMADINTAVLNVMTASGMANSGYSVVLKINNAVATDLSSAKTGDTISVSVSCTWNNVAIKYRPYSFIGSTKVLTGTAVMRKE